MTLCNDTVTNNLAGPPGVATTYGGGIYISSFVTVYIDSFTVAHTKGNTDSSGTNSSTANIDGTYIPQNC